MLKKDWPSTSVLARPTRGPRSHPTRRARAAPRAPPSTGPREQAPPRDPIPASLHSPPPRPARPPLQGHTRPDSTYPLARAQTGTGRRALLSGLTPYFGQAQGASLEGAHR